MVADVPGLVAKDVRCMSAIVDLLSVVGAVGAGVEAVAAVTTVDKRPTRVYGSRAQKDGRSSV